MAIKSIEANSKLKTISRLLFPSLSISFIMLLLLNKPLYLSVLEEDNFVEWLTFGGLFLSGIFSLILSIRIYNKYHYFHLFFIIFFIFNIFAGLEEISYGQRLFGLKTTGVFAKYSDQNEINIHNTLQGMFKMKTKHVALYALFIYGVIFPLLYKKGKMHIRWINEGQIILPPYFLITGFVLGTIFMLDFITGREEEVGEFLYSICFLIFVLFNLELQKKTNFFKKKSYFSREQSNPSFKA